MTNFGHRIGMRNVMLCHKDMHPLLLECFLASLILVRMIGGALIEYMCPLCPIQCVFYQNYFQLSSNMTNFGPLIGLENVMLYHKDMHPLLLECFLASLI